MFYGLTNEEFRSEIDDASKYLADGGLGEVIGFIDVAVRMSQGKVQMDTTMAIALCELANEALARRQSH